MPCRDWRLRLEDILEAINRIERYTTGMDLPAFSADEKTADAVVRNLEVVGEAARHVPDEVTRQYPDIPWDKMRGIRNVLAHEYFGLDMTIVWQTLKDDLPPLVPLLQRVLGRREADP